MNIVMIYVGHHCLQRVVNPMENPAGDTTVVFKYEFGNLIPLQYHLCYPGLDP